MKYSVVIPLYNKEKYIIHTVRSVLNQSFQDFEIIIVDDGSQDLSAEYAEKMKQTSDKITVIRQANQGVSVARNTGIEHASGQYIAFLDADDRWRDNYLETIDELTQKYPQSDFFVTAYCVDFGSGKKNYSAQLIPETGCLESYWLTYRYAYDFVWTSATVIRKEAVVNAGGFRPGEKIGQDLDLWARVARKNPKVAYSSKICVDYNRCAENNARKRVRIADASALIQDLEEELENPQRTQEEIGSIQHKYDLKMTVYAFTCILAGDKTRARQVLRTWKGIRTGKNTFLRCGLRIAMFMPAVVNRLLYAVRLKVF